MKRSNDWLQKLAEGMDLPGESVPGQTLVELAGDRRVLVENHAGVTAYSPEAICIKVKYGELRITGAKMTLLQMTARQLIIAGQIDGVELVRREC